MASSVSGNQATDEWQGGFPSCHFYYHLSLLKLFHFLRSAAFAR